MSDPHPTPHTPHTPPVPPGTVVERSSILQQLLTDQRDPYSRQRMTEEDLVPLPELQARIRAWVRAQREARAAAAAAAPMDESA